MPCWSCLATSGEKPQLWWSSYCWQWQFIYFYKEKFTEEKWPVWVGFSWFIVKVCLDLHHVDVLSWESIEVLASSCQHLVLLDFSNCDFTSSALRQQVVLNINRFGNSFLHFSNQFGANATIHAIPYKMAERHSCSQKVHFMSYIERRSDCWWYSCLLTPVRKKLFCAVPRFVRIAGFCCNSSRTGASSESTTGWTVYNLFLSKEWFC